MSNPEDPQPGASPPTGQPPDTQPHPRPPVPPALPPAVQAGGSVGGDVVSGDVHRVTTAGRDVVGRDVVTTTTTNVGFSAAAVQRLIITVGVLVFATAACFFSGGVFVGGAALAALNRPVSSDDPAAAAQFAEALGTVQGLPPGTPFSFTFTEQQISAYFRQVVAPASGVTDGKVRMLADGRLVVGGRAQDLGGLPFAAIFAWQETPGVPLRLTSAAVQALRLGRSRFGWVAVPTALLQPVAARVNQPFGNVRLTNVAAAPNQDAWTVIGISQ